MENVQAAIKSDAGESDDQALALGTGGNQESSPVNNTDPSDSVGDLPDVIEDDDDADNGDDPEQRSKKRPATLSHYRPPEQKPPIVMPSFTQQSDDSDANSASQTYEQLIRQAYSKVQQQVQTSRDLIEWQQTQQIGNTRSSSSLEFVHSRPIRTFARHNDMTHENFEYLDSADAEGSKLDAARRKTFRLNSADTDDVSSSCSSSSAATNDDEVTTPRLQSCRASSSVFGNRRYYSRGNSDDPDYFDYDLRHAVEQCRAARPTSSALAPPPFSPFEKKLFGDKAKMSGQATISSYMFQEEADGKPKRTTNFISSALRTASYWEYRYQNLSSSSAASKP